MDQPNSLPQLFGVIPTGLQCITIPTGAPSPTSYFFTFPSRSQSTGKPINFLTVFLLPGITLPPDAAAAVYIALPPAQGASAANGPQFKFLGGIGPGKESAVFKVSGFAGTASTTNGGGEVDMDADESNPSGGAGEITIGISLEPAANVSAQMASLENSSHSSTSSTHPFTNSSSALVVSRPSTTATDKKPDTALLAQRIIKNAFNFLASFSGNMGVDAAGRPIEVIPLKAFEEWWRKFEGRVRADPGFLERDADS